MMEDPRGMNKKKGNIVAKKKQAEPSYYKYIDHPMISPSLSRS